MIIEEKIAAELPEWRQRVSHLIKHHGNQKVCDVTVEQLYAGIRGVQIQVSDISYVEPYQGILLRGYSIPEILELLPKAPGSEIPLAGGLYYLLMVDRLPSLGEAQAVEAEWKKRATIPGYVVDVLRALPSSTHPMTMFSQAILALQSESVFTRQYSNGLVKEDYWKPTLEDSLNLTAKLPGLAACIYNLKYRDGICLESDPDVDWGASFAQLIGKGNDWEYRELMRLYMILHSDHEGGNVSAHTAHLVNSALSDIYYASSAAINGLAGPLHGVANQECIRWLQDLRRNFDAFPTREQLESYAWETLKSGQVIPGYGHAVLRVTDPRFTALLEFGKKYLQDDELFRLVNMVYEVLPEVLSQYGKVKNPWPNVDAVSGSLQVHYGLTQFDFHTVLFGVSRILGLTTHAVWARALGKPIERPKSLTTRMLEEMVETVRVPVAMESEVGAS